MRWIIGTVCIAPMVLSGNQESISWWIGTIVMCTIALMIWEDGYERQEQKMRIKEDIQTMWERGISVHVIAKKYSCEPIDIMRILGIWE